MVEVRDSNRQDVQASSRRFSVFEDLAWTNCGFFILVSPGAELCTILRSVLRVEKIAQITNNTLECPRFLFEIDIPYFENRFQIFVCGTVFCFFIFKLCFNRSGDNTYNLRRMSPNNK